MRFYFVGLSLADLQFYKNCIPLVNDLGGKGGKSVSVENNVDKKYPVKKDSKQAGDKQNHGKKASKEANDKKNPGNKTQPKAVCVENNVDKEHPVEKDSKEAGDKKKNGENQSEETPISGYSGERYPPLRWSLKYFALGIFVSQFF